MFCPKCGTSLQEGVKFCQECGAKVDSSDKATIQLRCKACGGLMHAEEDSPILSCQHCGSKELINESDSVRRQRIKSKAFKDVMFGRLKHEEEKEKRRVEKEKEQAAENRLNTFKNSNLGKAIAIAFAVCLIAAICSLSKGFVLNGLLALVQTVLFAAAWLNGMQFIKEKFKNMHLLLAVIGFVLVIPFLMLLANQTSEKNETYTWPENSLTEVLPQPPSNKGHISDSTDYLSLSVYKISQQDYADYVSACEAKGFTVEEVRGSAEFFAFNGDGYELDIDYFDSNKTMDISLYAPIKFTEMKWPMNELAKVLPAPKSTAFNIDTDYSASTTIYVGKTPIEAYNDYVNACSEHGFSVDHSKSDDYYRADNADGYHLYLEYEGFDTMSIRIEAPPAKKPVETPPATPEPEPEPAPAETTPAETASPASAQSTTNSGIRPEFKESMDSYEAFFDEYCEFMKKFSSSDSTAELMLEYATFMAKYADTMNKMDKLGDEDLSDEELAYYIEVTARIEQKLLAVA